MMNLTQNPVFQHTLRTMTDPNFQSPGPVGELIVSQVLEQHGYRVRIAHPAQDGYQLHVARHDTPHLRLAIRTARMTLNQKHRNSWRFRIWDTPGHKALFDVMILLCLLEPAKVVPFVIPPSALVGVGYVVIYTDPWTYQGRFANYRQSLYRINLDVRA